MSGMSPDVAEAMARHYHTGQTDRAGVDYCDGHLAAVAGALPPHLRALGWLHDIIEDTDVPAMILLEAGLSPDRLRVLALLTRLPGQDYDEYLDAIIAAGPDAIEVKLADLRSNTDPVRVAAADLDEAHLVRYYGALRRLSIAWGAAQSGGIA